MTRKNIFYTAALLLTGVVMVACSGSDDLTSETPQPQPSAETGVVELSGTLGSKGEGTRALAEDGTGSWETGDQFAVYYQTPDGHATAVATVNSVNANGSANFTATLNHPKNGSSNVTLVYPATAHDGLGGFNTDGLMTQDGTLEYITANGLDIETASTTLNVVNKNASLSSDVTMEPQVCLFDVTLRKDNYNDLKYAKTLEINDGTHSYTITPATPTQYFTVALLPVSHADFMFRAITSDSGMGFLYTKQNVTLANCTPDNVGDVFDEDGNIYAVSTGSGITYMNSFSDVTLEKGKLYSQRLQLSLIKRPVAVIAYVGERGTVDDSNTDPQTGFRGLALSMQNSEQGNTTSYNSNWDSDTWNGPRWCTQSAEACTSRATEDLTVARDRRDGITMTDELVNHASHTHYAAKTARNYSSRYYYSSNANYYFSNCNKQMTLPAGASNWFLPSIGQWELIAQGLASKVAGTAYTTRITDAANETLAPGSYNSVLVHAGAEALKANCDMYWSSSEFGDGKVWYLFYDGSALNGGKTHIFKPDIRAVVAF